MNTLDEVRTIIADELKVDVGEVESSTEIGELDGWDSLHNVQIFAAIENKFSIKLVPEQIMDLETVGDISELIDEVNS